MKSALVVDGEPPIRELLQEVLKAEGMKGSDHGEWIGSR